MIFVRGPMSAAAPKIGLDGFDGRGHRWQTTGTRPRFGGSSCLFRFPPVYRVVYFRLCSSERKLRSAMATGAATRWRSAEWFANPQYERVSDPGGPAGGRRSAVSRVVLVPVWRKPTGPQVQC